MIVDSTAGEAAAYDAGGRTAAVGRKTRVKRPTRVAAVVILAAMSAVVVLMCGACVQEEEFPKGEETNMTRNDIVVRTEEEWRSLLPPDRYKVLREKGTEPAFTGEYNEHWEDGVYHCYACDLPLFDSATKFHSGSGWPSFWQPVSADAVEEHADSSFGMLRTEVTCARCGGHLGHVFDDGPQPTGLRYCMNSLSLKFVPR